ncbi:16S rRNA (guanine(527)-N(7))-methyltransferase RsmG [Alphaproteobacteria bacterium]|mgnify:FL=1|nr:16S rRNA (guanine(527)-N(7))-methyltransferase RsmG [Alphaproteobacteria bacterium]
MSPQDFALKFDVSRETMDRLVVYQALLGKWQQRINLVGPATLAEFWTRHVADSAQLLSLARPQDRVWLDLGSGGGFPGLVLAMMLGPRGGFVHLVESDERKVAFLRTVIRETGAAAQVHLSRIEALSEAEPDFMADVQVITARALAALPKLLPLVAPFFNSSTIALLPKGRGWQEELTQAQQSWTLETQVLESVTDKDARVLKLTHLSRR